MSHIKDRDEKWAIALLQKVIDRSNEDRDALSGEAVKFVKRAKAIFVRRQKNKEASPRNKGRTIPTSN